MASSSGRWVIDETAVRFGTPPWNYSVSEERSMMVRGQRLRAGLADRLLAGFSSIPEGPEHQGATEKNQVAQL